MSTRYVILFYNKNKICDAVFARLVFEVAFS